MDLKVYLVFRSLFVFESHCWWINSVTVILEPSSLVKVHFLAVRLKVDQLLEDSRSTNTREQNMSALQRYDSVKNNVESARGSITFKEYYDLKLNLRLTESNLKYFKSK